MKLSILALSSVAFLVASSAAIARADEPAPDATVTTFTASHVPAPAKLPATTGGVQRCAVDHGQLVCGAVATTQGAPLRTVYAPVKVSQ